MVKFLRKMAHFTDAAKEIGNLAADRTCAVASLASSLGAKLQQCSLFSGLEVGVEPLAAEMVRV